MDVSCPVVFLMSNIWVSIPCIHLEDWGVWDSESQRAAGTATLLLSHSPIKAAQPDVLSPAQKWNLLPEKRY